MRPGYFTWPPPSRWPSMPPSQFDEFLPARPVPISEKEIAEKWRKFMKLIKEADRKEPDTSTRLQQLTERIEALEKQLAAIGNAASHGE